MGLILGNTKISSDGLYHFVLKTCKQNTYWCRYKKEKKEKKVEFSSQFVVALSYRYLSNHNFDPRPGFDGFGKTFDTHHKSKNFDEEGTYRMMTSELDVQASDA